MRHMIHCFSGHSYCMFSFIFPCGYNSVISKLRVKTRKQFNSPPEELFSTLLCWLPNKFYEWRVYHPNPLFFFFKQSCSVFSFQKVIAFTIVLLKTDNNYVWNFFFYRIGREWRCCLFFQNVLDPQLTASTDWFILDRFPSKSNMLLYYFFSKSTVCPIRDKHRGACEDTERLLWNFHRLDCWVCLSEEANG